VIVMADPLMKPAIAGAISKLIKLVKS
jgi:hypothetical protein